VSYQIEAYLERGLPALRLLDAHSGEERLHWHQPNTTNDSAIRQAWQTLFRRLIVLSCADFESPSTQKQLPVGGAQRQSGTPLKGIETAPLPTRLPVETGSSNVVYLPQRRSGVAR